MREGSIVQTGTADAAVLQTNQHSYRSPRIIGATRKAGGTVSVREHGPLIQISHVPSPCHPSSKAGSLMVSRFLLVRPEYVYRLPEGSPGALNGVVTSIRRILPDVLSLSSSLIRQRSHCAQIQPQSASLPRGSDLDRAGYRQLCPF